jgi:hypothetical protein
MPSPGADLDPVLTPDQLSSFRDSGFLCLDAITTPEEVASLRGILDRLFAARAGREEGAQYDILGHDEDDQPSKLPTIIRPVNFAPELRQTIFRAKATAIARQILGPEVTSAFEMAILKPAQHGGATPWHQDEATRADDSFEYRQISFWMPLQPATVDNGCMQYIPGSHLGEILPHRSPGDDPRIHAIECAGGFDPVAAVPCPLPAGGVVIHHGRTLHFAGPNTTDVARCAYILAFETPPVPAARPRGFHWNRAKRTANVNRRRRWRKRGGILVELVRRLRSGAISSPKRLLFEVHRALRALFRMA